MTTVRDVVAAIEGIAPPAGAESWDNVGLLAGRSGAEVDVVLLTIDLTEAVLAEAIQASASMIVAYHPPIFHPLKSITERSWRERVVLGALEAGIAIHAPHTALDAAPEGMNDWLAEGLGAGEGRALAPLGHLPVSESHKVVVFCPEDAVGPIRDALDAIGAGRIGAYAQCSFVAHGEGTFLGGASSTPTVGRRGVFERVAEARLEMVCPAAALADVERAVRAVHPYEEPPIEIHALAPRPRRDAGAGRLVTLERRVSVTTLADRVKKHLGVRVIKVATGSTVPKRVGAVGLCAGAGGSMIDAAIRAGAECFLTGEAQHHDCLDAVSRGCAVLLAGHTNTERGYLRRLRSRLGAALPAVEIVVSRKDGYPFTFR